MDASTREGALACLLVALVSCGPAADEAPGGEGTVAPILTPPSTLAFAEVTDPPLFTLGGADVGGPTQFSNIRSVLGDSRGRVWVADGGSSEVRVFDRDGRHLLSVGGRGRGPGEFGRPRLLGFFRGDSVAVWDDLNPRLTVYSPDGDFVRTRMLPPDEGIAPQAFGVFGDGRIVGQIPSIYQAAELEADVLLQGDVTLLALDEAGSRQELATVPGMKWIWTGEDQIPLPFSVPPSFAVVGEAVHVVYGAAPLVYAHEGGALVQSYGLDERPRPATSTERDQYSAYYSEALPDPRRRAAYVGALDHPELPHELPAYDRVLGDDAGRVWARRYEVDWDRSREWDVYRDAAWLGRIALPRGFELRAVRGTTALGIWRDELFVEHVRAYEFEETVK